MFSIGLIYYYNYLLQHYKVVTSSSDTWNVKEFKIVSKDEEELTDTEGNVSNLSHYYYYYYYYYHLLYT